MKRVVLYYLVIAAMLIKTTVIVTSCDKEDTKEREQCERLEQNGYSVTVCCGESGTVSITSEPWEYSDKPSETITITATANSGYRFLEWQTLIDGIFVSGNTNNPTTFGMYHDADAVVMKAIFVPSVGLPETIEIWQNSYGSTQLMYKYDSQNRYTEKTVIMNNSVYILDLSVELNYNEDGNLEKYSQHRSPSSRRAGSRFSKDDNIISFVFSPLGTANSSRTVNGELELNAEGLPVKLTFEEDYLHSYNSGSRTITSSAATFTWNNGNLTKTEWGREYVSEIYIVTYPNDEYHREGPEIEKGSSAGTITYTHDDKKTPFYNCNTPKWVFVWIDFISNEHSIYGNNKNYNKNNIKTETREDGSTITYEYTYNGDGFPVTRTWESANIWETGTITETYTYH